MPDIEETVRELLAKAAADAPAYDERKLDGATGDLPEVPPRAIPTRRRPRVWSGAAAAVLVAAAGITWWAAAQHEGSPGSASCASRLGFARRTYVGDGALLNLPRAGERLGVGRQPGCDDGASEGPLLDVNSIAGIAPSVAVLAEDAVWVNADLGGLPESIARMNRPVRCPQPGSTSLSGRVTGYHGAPLAGDAAPAPYSLILIADRGAALPLQQYVSVTVRLLVTVDTSGGSDAAFVQRALAHESRITATVRCAQHHFVALDIK